MASGLKDQFLNLGVVEKLIAVNVLVYIVDGLFSGLGGVHIVDWFALPKDFMSFLGQPWSLLTYAFFHGGFMHLLQNMLVLYFSGRILLNLFNAKTFMNVYFLGAILGGLFFLFGYNVFPTLVRASPYLIGASAGVSAVLIFACTYIPNREVMLFVFKVKLWWIGASWVLWNFIQIKSGQNIGGLLAHLGGAFLGYFYARQLLTKGTDIGSGLNGLYDKLGDLYKGSKKAPMKTVYRKKASVQKSKVVYEKETHQRKINAILDKISKSGYESLSKVEKDFLFKAGKEN